MSMPALFALSIVEIYFKVSVVTSGRWRRLLLPSFFFLFAFSIISILRLVAVFSDVIFVVVVIIIFIIKVAEFYG